jgi:hypothetical protein
MNPARAHYDKLLLLAAILALGGSLGWVRYERARFHSKSDEDVLPQLTGSMFQASIPNASVLEPTEWSEQQPQSSGADWRFELFTPPPIHVDAAGRVVVRSQKENPGVLSAAEPPEWNLLAIKPEPYRLQLTGYLGTASGYLAAFSAHSSREMWVVREGHRFEELGLKVLNLTIRNVSMKPNESDSPQEERAFAVVRDEWEDRDVQLDSGRVLLTDRIYAVVRLTETADTLLELRVGDTFTSGAFRYRVDRIQQVPAEILISRIDPSAMKRELHVLVLAEPAVPATVAIVNSISSSIRKNAVRSDP